MIKFKQIVECMVEHTPAGRRNGIDCVETSKRGLLGISEDGDLYRYDYALKSWNRQWVDVVPVPSEPASSTRSTEA